MNKTTPKRKSAQKYKFMPCLAYFRNRLLAGIVLAAVLLTVFNSIGPSKADVIFRDIGGHWAQTDIGRAVDAGFVTGYPDATFRPDMPVKRSEFITMLNAAFGVPDGGSRTKFTDVRDSDWFAREVRSAVNAGYMDIYTGDMLYPDLPIPRQEAAALTANLAGSFPGVSTKVFSDADAIADWARSQINELVGAGIMGGYPDGSFKPDRSITRAEAVALINKALIYEESEKVSASLRVTGSVVNIRSGPDTTYGILKKVYSGDMLEASLLSANNWYRIDAGGTAGWIIGSYVDVQNIVKNPPEENGDLPEQGSTGLGTDENTSRGGEPGRETGTDGGAGATDGTETDGVMGTDGSTTGSAVRTDGRLVVIDAGHGGYDDGATGPSGTREKDITLSIALKLSVQLKSAGYAVLLTRSDDTYVSLPDRSLTANNANASIFVSIHCNSSEYHNGHGTEVYTEPARSNPVYKQQEESRALAGFVQSELTKALGLTDRGIKEKDLAVCRETNLPAILIETAFIDNPEEEMLLSDPFFQDNAVMAIKRGIDSFFSGR